MPVGLYISVPFCRAKCSYCNFASGVFSPLRFNQYLARVAAEMGAARHTANQMRARFETTADSIYLGGGTPTILDVAQLEGLFVNIAQNFKIAAETEITVECAPGTLSPAMVEALARCGVNRVSLGVQSLVDGEARAVGRLHGRSTVIDDICRLRSSGISNINVDLIAGLPHQTRESWERSLDEMISLAVPHASIYLLEVDEDSRLGRELLAGGRRYHAHFVPDEDLTADFYELACERLNAAGIVQYEISNFARPGFHSRHNLKYWKREPYWGFGVDAHSMLERTPAPDAVRFSNPDSLDRYLAGAPHERTLVPVKGAIEEAFFLGLRLNEGVDLDQLSRHFGEAAVAAHFDRMVELVEAKLLERTAERIRLTQRGRLLSNEVFECFISNPLDGREGRSEALRAGRGAPAGPENLSKTGGK